MGSKWSIMSSKRSKERIKPTFFDCFVKKCLFFAFVLLQARLVQALHYQVNILTVRLVLLRNHDSLLVQAFPDGPRLHVEVGGHVHAVSRVQSRIQPIDGFDQWVLLRIQAEEIDWRLLVVVLLEDVDVQVLLVDRGGEAELLRAMINTNVLFVIKATSPTIWEVPPRGEPPVNWCHYVVHQMPLLPRDFLRQLVRLVLAFHLCIIKVQDGVLDENVILLLDLFALVDVLLVDQSQVQ